MATTSLIVIMSHQQAATLLEKAQKIDKELTEIHQEKWLIERLVYRATHVALIVEGA